MRENGQESSLYYRMDLPLPWEKEAARLLLDEEHQQDEVQHQNASDPSVQIGGITGGVPCYGPAGTAFETVLGDVVYCLSTNPWLTGSQLVVVNSHVATTSLHAAIGVFSPLQVS